MKNVNKTLLALSVGVFTAVGAVSSPASAGVEALVNVELRPLQATWEVGEEVLVGLYAVSQGPADEGFAGAQIILTWDPAVLLLTRTLQDGPYAWMASGFLPDADGLNERLDDGDAYYFALGSPVPVPIATTSGLLIDTLVFEALAPSPRTDINIPATRGLYSLTAVVDEEIPGFPITGELIGASVAIGQGCDAVAPELLHGAADVSFVEHAFSGYIDPRDEAGLTGITLQFSEPVRNFGGGELSAAAFRIRETGTTTPPLIAGLATSSDFRRVALTFLRPLTLRQWTTVIAEVEDFCGNRILSVGDLGSGADEPDRLDVGFLPGDVEQGGAVSPFDLVRFRQMLSGTAQPSRGVAADYLDTDRSGAVGPGDLIRIRQLLLGTPPATRVWLGQTMAASQP